MKTLLRLFAGLLTIGLPDPGFCQPVGPEFQINTNTIYSQARPSVAADGSGNFVVAWISWLGNGMGLPTSFSVQGKRFDAAGTPLGTEFQVNTHTIGVPFFHTDASNPSVAADASGRFVVVWYGLDSSGTDSSSLSVQGQRFDASGTPLGTQFQVNTYTTGYQARASVAADASGRFVVVWPSIGSSGTDSDSRSVQGQRFDASGTPLGTQFQVNTYTTDSQDDPSVAADASGSFVVVWSSIGSSGTDSSSGSVQGQRFDAAGVALGTEFQINTYTTYHQARPSVAADGSGSFVVVWNGVSVQGQRFDAAGASLGTQFQVNTYTTGYQARASVAADASGSFVVVWSSNGSSGTDPALTGGLSVQGRRFDAAGAPLGTQFQINTYTTDSQARPSVAADAAGSFVVVWSSDGSSGTDSSSLSVQGQRYVELCNAAPEPDGACTLADLSGVGKSRIQIKDDSSDTKDQLKWKWNRGTAVATADFKMPDSSTNTYRVCLYDAGGKLMEMNMLANGSGVTCDGKPCWRATGTKGFRYKNKTGSASSGITGAKFKEGAAGKSKIQIKASGKGGFLSSPPTLGLTEPLVIQLLIDDGISVECFKTTFSTFTKKDARNYKAKGP